MIAPYDGPFSEQEQITLDWIRGRYGEELEVYRHNPHDYESEKASPKPLCHYEIKANGDVMPGRLSDNRREWS